jgi:hypothetical protein
MIRTLIALPYELARRPVALVDSGLTSRLPATSVPRLVIDRAMGSADRLAGTILGSREITDRGTDRLVRSKKLATAARLETQAEVRREQAQETIAAGKQEAAQQRAKARDKVESGLEEADVAEARGKREAQARATKTAQAKKKAANQRATSRKATVEQREQRVASAAEAKKRAAQSEAKSELDEARQNKQAAADARADAERLSELTAAKKRQRTQD